MIIKPTRVYYIPLSHTIIPDRTFSLSMSHKIARIQGNRRRFFKELDLKHIIVSYFFRFDT